MQNNDYKHFRDCEIGDYDHLDERKECAWCASDFSSSILKIEQGKYLSILMVVRYQAGGNWGNTGYNSLNFLGEKKIEIPTDQNVKKMLIKEIEEYLSQNPMVGIDAEGIKYPIINEIQQWNIDDLTFYFKEDVLRLIFNNGAHGVWNQTFDFPLPRLQKYLNL